MQSLFFLGLLGSALQANAHPHPALAPRSRSDVRPRVVDLNNFRLKATAKYVNTTEVSTNPPVTSLFSSSYVDIATALVKQIAPGTTFRLVDDHYVGTNGIAHVNFKQTAHGLDIDNADFNVNVGPDGQVFSFGNNFFTGTIPAENPLRKRAFKDPVTALDRASSILQLGVDGSKATPQATGETETFALSGATGTVKEPEARLVYLVKSDGNLALTWRVETDIMENWLLTYVDAVSGQDIHGVVDYVAHATYLVYPWGINDPTEGDRVLVTDPWDRTASEFGHHSDGFTMYNTTRGNNGIAQVNPSGGSQYLNNYRPVSEDGNYVYPFDLTMTNASQYANASITQLFYTANIYHDLLYLLGFTEKAGNFEVNVNGQGGRGNDSVILNAQDGSGTNNANFATPPDGQMPRMRMYLWDLSNPIRDCTFEAGVVIHEYTHGLSNRLTGGPANSGCLSALESGGMGEGWGDFMATAIRLKPSDTRATDYAMGAWVFNDPAGIRNYKYSTSLTTNPYTYSSVDGLFGVHSIGEVWATMLYEVLWNLIDKHGKNDGIWPTFVDGVPTDGKYLMLKLVVDAMALQPCNPNFVQGRDAILDADKALTKGANQCEIWKGFAKRGLGYGAVYNSSRRTSSTAIPPGVC